MTKGIIIGILIYSLILTIVTLYKDNSSYFTVDSIDIITAGPITWLLIVMFIPIRYVVKNMKITKKKKERTMKDEKYISKVVYKIVKNYIKKMKNKNYREYFDFNIMSGEYNVNDIEGWKRLEVLSPVNEKINNKFSDLMFHQKNETIKELKKYFKQATPEDMIKDDLSTYWINQMKGKEVYILM